ncbi:MAG: hypothetical protein WBV82_05905 [Myxococcaceae bacterium]
MHSDELDSFLQHFSAIASHALEEHRLKELMEWEAPAGTETAPQTDGPTAAGSPHSADFDPLSDSGRPEPSPEWLSHA